MVCGIRGASQKMNARHSRSLFFSSVPSKYDAARAGITNATYQSWSSAMSILCVLCSSSGNHNIRPQLVPSGIVREAPEIERDWLATTARNTEAEKSHCTY